jgi:hypothetical protein
MPRLHELLSNRNWYALRAIAYAHGQPFNPRLTKEQAVDHIAALLSDPVRVRRALAALPGDAHEALQALLVCDGTMLAHRFLAHFGPLPPFRPWRPDSPPAPWRHPTSPAERLWFLGLLFRCSTPAGEAIAIPDELRALLPPPPVPPPAQPAGPPLPVPDPVLDVAHLLAFLQGHDLQPFAGRWLAPRHLRTLNAALSRPDPSAAAARSELQTGYVRSLHYLAQAAGLVAPAAGLLKPTPAAWNWLDASEARRWQTLWDGWLADLHRSPHGPSLWARFRMPAEPPFVRTVLDALSTLPRGDWWNPPGVASQLRSRCIGAGTLPRDGAVLPLLQTLLLGPLTWAALVCTDRDGNFSLTPWGGWLLGRLAEPPGPPPTRPATVHASGDCLVVTLPAPPGRPPLRPLAELALPPAGDDPLVRRLTRARFVAGLAHGIAGAQVNQTLGDLAGEPPPPAAIEQLERWEVQARGLTLRRLTVLTAADPSILNQLSAERAVRRHFRETLSPHHVAVDPSSVETLLRALHHRDHVPLVEPGAAPPPGHRERPGGDAAGHLWLALRAYVDLAGVVRLPAVPPLALLDELSGTLDADQLAAVTAQAEEVHRRLRDALDGYTPFSAPLAGVDHAAIRASLEQAIEAGHAVEIVYHTAGRGERTTRVVEPLRLEDHGETAYLIAYCRLRQAERVFRIDRIESLVVSS